MSQCPICRKEVPLLLSEASDPSEKPPHFPFCSSRCKMVDLHKWFSGSYAIPTEEFPSGEDDDGVEQGPSR